MRMPVRNYDESGQLTEAGQLVREAGFVVGASVCRKRDNTAGVITGFQGDSVILHVSDGALTGSCRVLARSFLKKEWSKFTPKQEAMPVENHWQHSASGHPEFEAMYVKAKISMALFEATSQHADVLPHLKVQAKPCKAVFAGRSFERHSLVLVPSTTRISSSALSKASFPNANVPLGALTKRGDEPILFSLAPTVTMPKDNDRGFISPFFFVQVSHTASECNMELHPNLEGHQELNVPLDQLTIKLPLMRNKRAVKAGDQLIVYREKSDKEIELEDLVSTDPAPPAKRIRTKRQA